MANMSGKLLKAWIFFQAIAAILTCLPEVIRVDLIEFISVFLAPVREVAKTNSSTITLSYAATILTAIPGAYLLRDWSQPAIRLQKVAGANGNSSLKTALIGALLFAPMVVILLALYIMFPHMESSIGNWGGRLIYFIGANSVGFLLVWPLAMFGVAGAIETAVFYIALPFFKLKQVFFHEW